MTTRCGHGTGEAMDNAAEGNNGEEHPGVRNAQFSTFVLETPSWSM